MLVFKITILIIMALLINIPLGYLRRHKKKYSFAWFFYIHASIPLLYPLRTVLNVPIEFVPLFILFAVGGQFIGLRKSHFFTKNVINFTSKTLMLFKK